MSALDSFDFDVFLSHNALDKPVVVELAERLRDDGLRVWLDDWVIQPGDLIPKQILEGLEKSRVLLMLLSRNFGDSDWATFESGTFLFCDPGNRARRFIPVRLDDSR